MNGGNACGFHGIINSALRNFGNDGKGPPGGGPAGGPCTSVPYAYYLITDDCRTSKEYAEMNKGGFFSGRGEEEENENRNAEGRGRILLFSCPLRADEVCRSATPLLLVVCPVRSMVYDFVLWLLVAASDIVLQSPLPELAMRYSVSQAHCTPRLAHTSIYAQVFFSYAILRRHLLCRKVYT